METKKQIEARLRNKILKEFKEDEKKYQFRIDNLVSELTKTRTKNDELKARNEELEEKVAQYEDWINRLQDFCNLNDEDRKKAIEDMKYKTYIDNKMSKILGNFHQWFDGLASFM